MGGLTFDLIHLGPAHAADDGVVVVREEGLIYSGDIIFAGRIPFVGSADSGRWPGTTGRLIAPRPRVMVPGHGKVSTDPARDLELTREYLTTVRVVRGTAVEQLMTFEEAYSTSDGSRFAVLPATKSSPT